MTTAVSTRPSLSFFRCRVFQLEFYYGHASDTALGPSPGHCLRQQGGGMGDITYLGPLLDVLGHQLVPRGEVVCKRLYMTVSRPVTPFHDAFNSATLPSNFSPTTLRHSARRCLRLPWPPDDASDRETSKASEERESDDPGNGNNQGNNNETESDKAKENERRTTRRKWNLSAGRGEDLQSSKAPSAHPASSPSTPPPRRTPTCTPRAARTCARTASRPSGPTA